MIRHKLRMTACAAVALLIAAPGIAFADAVDDLMLSVKSDLKQVHDIQAKRDDLVSQNENDMKAYDAVKSSYDSLLAEAKSTKAQWEEQVQKRYDAFDTMVDEFNAQCAADQVGELEEAAYNACNSRKAELEPYVAQGRAAVEADDQHFIDTVMKPKIAILQQQEAGMDDYAARIKARFDQTNAMDVQLKALRSHALQTLGGLGDACKGASSMEAVKYCNAIDWDGAGPGALTIEQVAPIALAWPG